MKDTDQPVSPLDMNTVAWQTTLFVLLSELDSRGVLPGASYVKALENRIAFGKAMQEPGNPVLQQFLKHLGEQFPPEPTPGSRAG